MKAIYKNIALAALALSAVACTQEEDFASSYLNDPDAVRITAQVASGNVTGGFTRSNPLGTTEDEQAKFNGGDKIAVTANGQAAVTYTFNGTDTWTPEAGKYLKWETNSMNFTAWYPVGEGTDAQNFTPNYGQTASLEELQANDYMTFSENIQKNGNDNSVSIELERQMARIVISEINYGNQYNATTNAVESIDITAGSSKYTNGAWDDTNVTAQMYKHTDGDWYAVLPPTATAEPEENFLAITLATGDELIVKGIPATAAGQSYDYILTVGKDKATIGNVTVADWGTSQTIPGGEAEEVKTSCNLPEPDIFINAILAALYNNSQLTKIEFKANSNVTSNTQIGTCGAYLVANEAAQTLEIHTSASVFVFPENCEGMFIGNYFYGETGVQPLSRITSINFNNFVNTSNVTDMNNMFRSLSALKELDLSCFDTSNVTDMGLMFAYCSKLEMLNLSSFNVNKVTNFKNMLWMMSTLENGKKTLVYVPNPNPFEDKNTGINNNIQQKPANSEYAEYVIGTPQ